MRCRDILIQREERVRKVLLERETTICDRRDAEIKQLRDLLTAETITNDEELHATNEVANATAIAREEHGQQTSAHELKLAKLHAQIQALHSAPVAPTCNLVPNSHSKTKAMLTAPATVTSVKPVKPRPKAKCTAGEDKKRRSVDAAKEAPPEVPTVVRPKHEKPKQETVPVEETQTVEVPFSIDSMPST